MPTRNFAIRLSVKDGDTVKRALKGLGADGEAALRRIERQGKPASRALLAVNDASAELRGGISGLAARLGPVGAGLAALGPAGAAAAAGLAVATLGVSAALRGSAEAIKRAEQIDIAAQKLDTSAQFLQEVAYAAKEFNINEQTLDMALQRLSRRMGEVAKLGKGELKPALEAMGLEVRRADGSVKSLEEFLPEFAEGLKNTDSQAERLALTMKAFDSEGVVLVNLLEKGAGGLERLRREARDSGAVLNDDFVRYAKDASTELKKIDEQTQTTIDRALIPLGGVLADLKGLWADPLKGMADFTEGLSSQPLVLRSAESIKAQMSIARRHLDDLEKEAEERRSGKGSIFDRFLFESDETIFKRLDEKRQLLDRLSAELISRGISDRDLPDLSSGGGGGGTLPETDEQKRIRERTDARKAQLRAEIDGLQDLIRARSAAAAAEADAASGEQFARVKRENARAVAEVTAALEAEKAILQLGLEPTSAAANAVRELTLRKARLKLAEQELSQSTQEAARLNEEALAPLERLNRALARHQALLDKGLISSRAFAHANEEAYKRFEKNATTASAGASRALRAYADEATDVAKAMEGGVTTVFKGLEDTLVSITNTSEGMAERMRRIALSVVQDLQRIMIRATITGPLAESVLGAFGGGAGAGASAGSGTVNSARGNAFEGGRLVPFALGGAFLGGVFDSPFAFPMSDGRTGVGAEAGRPEAIMPLTRNSGGELGVKAVGMPRGGGRPVVQNNVTINAAGGTPAQNQDAAERNAAEFERMLQESVRGIVVDEMRPGGTLGEVPVEPAF
nr:hypothetical protein 2 [bacterium]